MTNNTKINHIIASSRDHSNSNFIDRVAYKYKYKYEPIFSSYAQLLFQLKNVKNSLSYHDSLEYTKYCAKKHIPSLKAYSILF